jgi:hypothetical protein
METSKYKDTQVYLHTMGLKIRKISSLIGDSLGEISPLFIDSSKINSVKTKDFLYFTDTKSRLNSWRIMIHRHIALTHIERD